MLLGAACARPVTITEMIRLDLTTIPEDMEIEILVDGVPARGVETAWEGGSRTARFQTTGTLQGNRYRSPAVKLRALFACGWREFPLPARQETAEDIRRQLEHDSKIYVSLDHPDFDGQLIQLWVDNRKGAAAVLTAGAATFAVPADGLKMFLLWSCETASPLALDGSPIGALPATADLPGWLTVLVEPTGLRCYDQKSLQYAPSHERIGLGPQSPPVHYSGKKLHLIPLHINHFMSDAPSHVSSTERYPTTVSFNDARCR